MTMMEKKYIAYAISSILLLGTSLSASASVCKRLDAHCIIGFLPVNHNELNKTHQTINNAIAAGDQATLT
ncbi:hypothetical protein, partial [Edwardsiella hoshinae]